MSLASIPTEELFRQFPVETVVSRVLEEKREVLDSFETAYRCREAIRKQQGLKSLAFCGYGRAGKDEAGRHLIENYGYGYSGSLSRVVTPYWAWSIGRSLEETWTTRHLHRRYWYEWTNEFRRTDPARLVRMGLGVSDLAVGIRDVVELQAVKQQRICSLLIWIDRPGIPVDPTVTYTKEDCDEVIVNPGDDIEAYRKVLNEFFDGVGLSRVPM